MSTPDSHSHSQTPNADHPTLSPEQMASPPSSAGADGSDSHAARVQHRDKVQRQDSDPNAQSIAITQADGVDTGGVVNRHPNPDILQTAKDAKHAASTSKYASFRVGVSEDRNRKCRRTMEDAHAFVYDYGGVKGQGYFAVFDGHAGKHAAEWCGANFHKYLLEQLASSDPSQPIPDLLNHTFHIADGELSKLAAQGGTHSGCTAVTAFLRLEDADGHAVQLDQADEQTSHQPELGSHAATGGVAGAQQEDDSDMPEEERKRKFGDGIHRERLRSLFSGSGSGSTKSPSTTATTAAADVKAPATTQTQHHSDKAPAIPRNMAKRTLYTANVGDARAVLCRGGKAVRLTYDHKGSDAQEAKRITDAGGFVMNNRVNGVLAVTRSLGDSSMKEFVVGSPYTTETTLGEDDDFLIIACDGLWDVCEDQQAVDLIRNIKDAQEASQVLLDHALQNYSTDNLSVLVVHLKAADL